jgi:hypothetical protein
VKQAKPVVAITSSDIHQQYPLTSQQIQQLHHMHMLQQMVELQQQLVQTHQPQAQPPSTHYPNNFGQFPFISYNLAAAAAAASSQANSKSHPQSSPSLSLLQLHHPSQSTCSSNGSERSYSSTSSSQSSSSMATEITTTTDHEGSSMTDHHMISIQIPNQTYRGSHLENESPRSVEDDAEMVFTALTHMRSEILKNSSKDH